MISTSRTEDELLGLRATRALAMSIPLALLAALATWMASSTLDSSSAGPFSSESTIELTDTVTNGVNVGLSTPIDHRETSAAAAYVNSSEFDEAVRFDLGADGAAVNWIWGEYSSSTPLLTIEVNATKRATAVAANEIAVAKFIEFRIETELTELQTTLGSLRERRDIQVEVVDGLTSELEAAHSAEATTRAGTIQRQLNASITRLAQHEAMIQDRELLVAGATGQVTVLARPSKAVDLAAPPSHAARAGAAFVVFIVGALLVGRFRNRLEVAEEVAAIAGAAAPVLAVMPEFQRPFRRGSETLVVGHPSSPPEANAFCGLCTRIEVATEGRTPIAISLISASTRLTSAVVTANLVLSIARLGRSVGVVDGTFPRGIVSQLFAPQGDNALHSVIDGSLDPTSVSWPPAATSAGQIELLVSRNRSAPDETPEVSHAAVTAAFERLRQVWDVVAVDCPPIGTSSWSTLLASASDAVILVVPLRRTKRRELEDALAELTGMKAPMIGIVVTHAKSRFSFRSLIDR